VFGNWPSRYWDDHVASIIVNANHSIAGAAEKLRVVNCVGDCVWLAVPPPEWHHIGNQIDAALVAARADFVKVDAHKQVGNTILKAGASGANISNYSATVTSLGYNLSSDDRHRTKQSRHRRITMPRRNVSRRSSPDTAWAGETAMNLMTLTPRNCRKWKTLPPALLVSAD
jgi:hypothetical protein